MTPQGEGTRPDDAFDTSRLRANLKARAVSGMLITVSTQGAKLVLQILYLAVMSRLLSPGDFGLIAMVTSMIAILAVVRDGGLTTATIQRAHVSHEEASGMFWVNTALGLLLAALTMAISPVLAWFYKDPHLIDVTLLYAVTFILAGLMVQQEAIIRRNMRFATLGAIEIATLMVSSLTGIASAWLGSGYWAIVYGMLAGNVTNVVLLWHSSKWRPGVPSWPSGLGSMLKFGGHIMTYNLVSALGMNVDKVLLGRLYGSYELGFYSRAQVLLMQPFTQILVPLGSVAIPTLSRLHTEPAKFTETLLRLVLLVGFVSSFASAFIFAGADAIVRIVLGEGWSQTAAIVRAFAISMFTMPISVVATWALTTSGLGKALSHWGMVNNGILLVAIICGLPWHGLGVAIAFSVSGILLRVPLFYYFLGKKTGIGFRGFVRVVGPAFVAFVLAASGLYAVAQAMEDYDAVLRLIVLLLGSVLAAALSVVIHPWGREVWTTVNDLAASMSLRRMWSSD